ncbi:MAG: DUF4412 domain-containing protein [Bacteroidia bacterium]|nr:DUF4412 domain-containing protein [Bacteroidia bacterium]
MVIHQQQSGMNYLALFLFITLPTLLWAQPKITEGKLFYDITYQNLSEQMKGKESQLPHDASFYFKNKKSRIEMGAGSLGKNVTITDQTKKLTIVLLNIYNKKFAILKTDSEMLEVRKSFQPDTAKTVVKVEVINEQKKIAGYTCQKAIITRTTNGIIKKSDCWFTKDLPSYNTQYDEAYKMIDGFLMQYNITEAGMTMMMTVKMIMPIPIDDKMFEVPEGYRVLTEKELMKVLNVLQQDQSGY